MEPILAHAICRCPFLGELARRNGAEYAKSIAVNPTVPAASGVETGCSGRRPVLEDYESYELTFRAFHGPRGVCPLQNRSPVPVVSPPTHSTQPPVLQEPSPTSCAVIIGGVPELPQRARRAGSGGVQQAYNVPCSSAAARALHPQAGTAAATAAPFATLSMSFGRNLVRARCCKTTAESGKGWSLGITNSPLQHTYPPLRTISALLCQS